MAALDRLPALSGFAWQGEADGGRGRQVSASRKETLGCVVALHVGINSVPFELDERLLGPPLWSAPTSPTHSSV
eukprot:365682-Chlamydomonas_euryale.AAC.13